MIQTPQALQLLLVDDSPEDRQQIRSLLEPALQKGWQLTEVECVEQALKVLDQKPWSCMLLDTNLPDGTGLDLIEHLEKLERVIPYIVTTGVSARHQDYRFMDSGAYDYLRKELLTEDSLMRTIRYAVKQGVVLQNARHLAAEALAAKKVKDDFLHAMSHELRTPLQAIMGYAESLELGFFGPLSEEQREPLTRICEATRQLDFMMDEIMCVSDAERGELALDPKPTELIEILEEQLGESRFLAQAKGIPLLFTGCKDITVKLDSTRVKQVIGQILKNAIEFTDSGNVEITVSQRPKEVVIQIADTGVGMSKQVLDNLFTAFWQPDTSLSRSHQGLGIGLTFSRQIMEMHGGRLEIDSTEGVGTTCRLVFPRSGAHCKN